MAHHNSADRNAWPHNPDPTSGHHPAPAPPDDTEDDQTTSEARAAVQPPTHPQEKDR